MKHWPRAACSTALFALTACSLAPEYHTPEMPIPEAYKEAGDWQPAKPEMANADRGNWWRIYNDPDLDALEDKVTAANQDLKAAYSRYREARAEASVARAALFPQITVAGDATRQKLSKSVADSAPVSKFNDFDLEGDFSYEIDVWGRVRNSVEAAKAVAQASAADVATVDLSLHAELAMDYFQLHGDDAEQKLLDETVVAYQKAYELTKIRHQGGAAAEADVDQAETQLENAKTQASDMRLRRSQLEHAIAVLAGEMPSGFSIAPAPLTATVPSIAAGLPSTLLEQRPDISAAAFRVQSANAEIGVARAAYFPDFTLGADLGVESALFPKLFTAPSLLWSIGPSFTQPIFEGGRLTALTDVARADYDESVANYRSTVLQAFQQVEDSLVAMHRLGDEDVTQKAASDASDRALQQAMFRYKGGIASYLDVVYAQNTSLQAELSSLDVHARRMVASVLLIKAVGGVWNTDAPATGVFPSPFSPPDTTPTHLCVHAPSDISNSLCTIPSAAPAVPAPSQPQ